LPCFFRVLFKRDIHRRNYTKCVGHPNLLILHHYSPKNINQIKLLKRKNCGNSLLVTGDLNTGRRQIKIARISYKEKTAVMG
jgi:hypothetical protein